MTTIEMRKIFLVTLAQNPLSKMTAIFVIISATVPASLRAHELECPRALRAQRALPWGKGVGRFFRDHHPNRPAFTA